MSRIVDVVKPNESTKSAYPASERPTDCELLARPIMTMPAMLATRLTIVTVR